MAIDRDRSPRPFSSYRSSAGMTTSIAKGPVIPDQRGPFGRAQIRDPAQDGPKARNRRPEPPCETRHPMAASELSALASGLEPTYLLDRTYFLRLQLTRAGS